MIKRGTFKCAICGDRLHTSNKNEEYRSYFPEKKILVCDYCLHEYHTDPDYEHLRPDITPQKKQEIRKKESTVARGHTSSLTISGGSRVVLTGF
jgi:DNA-directed RNA polymerase subunit M/transcription elongation factor TFIIS